MKEAVMTFGTWGFWNVGLAALLGAAGVALAAAAAHGSGDPLFVTAAQFLMIHGAAALALTALGASAVRPGGYLLAASVMIAAVALFSGDLAFRAYAGERLFPFAAPLGGSLLIVAWLIGVAAGIRDALAGRS
jgi:uncharacterized membrane protein YgdD (TMEM256/DUF423 family)